MKYLMLIFIVMLIGAVLLMGCRDYSPSPEVDLGKESDCKIQCEKLGTIFSYDYQNNRCTCTAL